VNKVFEISLSVKVFPHTEQTGHDGEHDHLVLEDGQGEESSKSAG
jgi:hypothetical protein